MKIFKTFFAIMTCVLACVFCNGAGANNKANPSAIISHNYRAFALEIDDVNAAIIKAGDKIDFMFAFEAIFKDNPRDMMSTTILQDILVLKTVKIKGRNYWILSLTPFEVQYTALSQRESPFPAAATLRSDGDNQRYPVNIAFMSKIENDDFNLLESKIKRLYALPVPCESRDIKNNSFANINALTANGKNLRFSSVAFRDKLKIGDKCYRQAAVSPELAQILFLIEQAGGKFSIEER
ncbi:MAG: hypothetical protein LBL00_05515 [Endomicrobium sp.]|jgi:hypothetical protein|nr:hypothetical protein [Endomicrobium sp.]